MAIPVWPKINYLANQGSGTFALSDGKGKATTEMDSGETRTRIRFKSTIIPHSLAVLLTYEEMALFEYFYYKLIGRGAFWFYMPIQRGNRYEPQLVKLAEGNEPSTSEAGFNAVNLSLNLMVRDLTTISKEVYDYFNTIGINSGGRLSDVVTKYVEQDYPRITKDIR